jgi:hypothetical protein
LLAIALAQEGQVWLPLLQSPQSYHWMLLAYKQRYENTNVLSKTD